MDSKKIANYIEELRYSIKISQEEFLSGVISPRQYQRYRKGECEIPMSVISSFCKKLGITEKKFFNQYDLFDINESNNIREYFNSVLSRNFNKSNDFEDYFCKNSIISSERRKLYNVAKRLKKFYLKEIDSVTFVNSIYTYIGIDEILKRDIVSDINSYLLGLVLEYSELYSNRIINFFSRIYKNEKVLLSGNNRLADLQVIYWLCKTTGRLGNYNEVLSFVEKAYFIQKRYKVYYLVEYFLYYECLAYYYLEKLDKFLVVFTKLVLYINYKSEEVKHNFSEKIMYEFKIDVDDFFATLVS